jgi:hypothetical protein
MFVSMLHRYPLWLACVVSITAGLLLRADVVYSGFYTDDFDHYAMHVGRYPVPRAPLDKFNFGDGTPVETRALVESGHFPWWSSPRIQLSMLRPVSSALIAADFWAFGLDSRWFHVHSLLWWCALVVAVTLLLGRVLPTPMAALAVLLFAIEEGHGLPAGWLANRSTLVATTFGVLAVHAHLVAREDGKRGMRVLSLVCVALSLASGEYAFGPLAYLFAYEFVTRTEPWMERVRSLAPAGVLAIAYLGLRGALGYGIAGSGFYISLTSDPLAFVRALVWRVPVLAGDLALGVPADWYLNGSPWRGALLRTGWFTPDQWRALPDWTAFHVALGASALLGVAWALRRAARWVGPDHARTLQFLVIGAVLSLVPVAGSMVSARLTVAASIGFDALIAAALLRAFSLAQQTARIRSVVVAVLACTGLLYVHVHTASRRSQLDAMWHRERARLEYEWVMSAEVDAAELPGQRVFVVSTADLTSAWYLPYVRMAMGQSVPRSYTLLSGASQPHDLVRVSERAFELHVLTNNVGYMAVGGNYRSADEPFAAGDTVEFQGLRAEVIRVLYGQPHGVRFTFPKSVTDGEYVFLESTERGLRRVQIPAIGQSVRLRRPVYPNPQSLQWRHADLEKQSAGPRG